MMSKPLVSIITPCYNGEKFVHRLLDSILKQDYNNLEFIFVNDGSTDRTKEVVFSYKERFEKAGVDFKYVFQENKGQASAINQGLKLVTGKYLTWPDSDDYFSKNSIREKVSFLENNPSYKFVRSNVKIIELDFNKTTRINDKSRFNEDIFEDLLLLRAYVFTGCYLVTTKTFFTIYPKRKIYESREGQNLQMLVPIASVSKCGFIDKELYCYVKRPSSHSRIKRSFAELVIRYNEFEKILINTLSYSRCDYKKYEAMVHALALRRMMGLAFEYKKEELAKKTYLSLQKNGWLLKSDRAFYYRQKYPLIRLIERTIPKPVLLIIKKGLKKL